MTDLPADEPTERQKHLSELEDEIAGLIDFLTAHGVDVTLGDTRLTHFAKKLVDYGILTDEQATDIWIDYSENIVENLRTGRKQVETMMEKRAAQQRMATLLHGGSAVHRPPAEPPRNVRG